MRAVLIFFIVLYSFISCKGQYTKNATSNILETLDTLSVLSLKGRKYNDIKYKIVHIGYSEKGQEQIQLLENNILIYSVWIPIADEEVKNFSLNKIQETRKGFKMSVDWGGGNYFYKRTFFFSYIDGKFYLYNLEIKNFTQNPENKESTRKSIKPLVEISQFNIFDYINSE